MVTLDPPAEVTENLVMLGTNPYPLFLFKGRAEGVLFEGGTSAMGALVLEQLAALGIGRDFVKRLVVTHAHPDHVMAIPCLRRAFPSLTVLASAAAAKTLAVDKAIAFFCKVDGALTRSLTEKGMITEAHHAEPLGEMRIPVDQTIAEGDTIEVGDDARFAVLETPGHSDCSLSFHEPRLGILILSDATGYYLPESDYWWPNYFTDYGTYVDSMRRLRTCDAETLCVSHNVVVRGKEVVRSYFDRAIAQTEAYHRRIISEVTGGKTVRELAEELGAEVHARKPLLPLDFFQKNCGLLVKLSLKHEGLDGDR